MIEMAGSLLSSLFPSSSLDLKPNIIYGGLLDTALTAMLKDMSSFNSMTIFLWHLCYVLSTDQTIAPSSKSGKLSYPHR